MKTAISIDDSLLHEVDETARRMGLSRSGVFALAARELLRRNRSAKMLAELNRVYVGEPDSAEKQAVKAIKRKVRAAIRDAW
jgi:metal-responsive CopG/Arc/MetJ family transcriptional regulator